MDLDRFGRAMRLRWLWLEWTDDTRPWCGMQTPCDKTDRQLFRASTEITLGDGAKCRFWLDAWTHGGALRHQFPELFAIATRKTRTVQKEMENNNWIRSLANISTARQLAQYTRLWALLQAVVLLPVPDSIRCRWTESGVYTAASGLPLPVCGFHAPFPLGQILERPRGGQVPVLCMDGAPWQAPHSGQLGASWVAKRPNLQALQDTS